MQLVTAKEVAHRLRKAPDQIYDLARRGIIPCVRVGRSVLFESAAIDAFIARGGQALPGGWKREPSDRSAA